MIRKKQGTELFSALIFLQAISTFILGQKDEQKIIKPAHNSTFANMAGLVVIETFCF